MYCPNTNSKLWKELSDEVGEYKALALFHAYKGDYEHINNSLKKGKLRPEVDELEMKGSELKKITKAKNKALANLSNQISQLRGAYIRGAKKDNAAVDSMIKGLTETFEKIESQNFFSAIGRRAENSTNIINKTIKGFKSIYEGDSSHFEKSAQLMRAKSNLNIQKDLINNTKLFTEASQAGLITEEQADEYINEISRSTVALDRADVALDSYERKLAVEAINRSTGVARGKRKRELEKEFNRDNPRKGIKPDEYKSRRMSYVHTKLREESDELAKMDEVRIDELLTKLPKDISGAQSWLYDQRSINDNAVQAVVKMLDESDLDIDTKFMEAEAKFKSEFEKFLKTKPKEFLRDPMSLYGDYIEKDDKGNPTGYYQRPLKKDYTEAVAKYQEDIKNAVIVDENTEEREPDFKKRVEINQQFIKDHLTIPVTNSSKTLTEQQLKFVQDKEKNPGYEKLMKNDSFFKSLMEFNEASDKLIPKYKRLGYRIPYQRKGAMEVVATTSFSDRKEKAGSFLKNLQGQLKELYKPQVDELEMGEIETSEDGKKVRVKTNSDGTPMKGIPMLLRNQGSMEEMSFDLAGLALSNRYASLNYASRSKIKNDIEMILSVVGKRSIGVTQNGKSVYHSIKDIAGLGNHEIADMEVELDTGMGSNVYKVLESIIHDRLYGESKVASYIGSVDMNRLIGTVSGLTAKSMLSFNWLGSGLSNALQGSIANVIMSGNETFFSKKDHFEGRNKYFKDGKGILDDLGALHKKSKTNQFVTRFMPEGANFNGLKNDLLEDAKYKRIIGWDNLQVFSDVGEKMISGTLIYSMMNNMKVMDSNGKYVDKDGNVVSDRSKAATIDEMYSYNEKKELWEMGKLPNGEQLRLEGHQDKDLSSKEIELIMRRKIQEAYKRSQGNYSDRNKAMFQRFWAGNLVGLMRRWMVPSIQKRWRGKIGGTGEEFYNESIDEFDEGTYVTTLRFLKTLTAGARSVEQALAEWNTLTEAERGRVKETMHEFAIVVIAAASTLALRGLAEGAEDDEDSWISNKELYLTMLYLSQRMQQDLLMYSYGAPFEVNRTLSSPSTAFKTVSDAITLMYQVLFPWEWSKLNDEYKAGRRAGQNKFAHKFNKLVNPIYKQFYDKDIREVQKQMDNLTN